MGRARGRHVARIHMGVEHNAQEIEQKFARIAPALPRATREGVRRASIILARALEDGDNSTASWRMRPVTQSGTGFTTTVDATEDTQSYREFGTRSHDIFPRRKSALSFYWNKVQGRRWYAHVRHPGQAAKPYVERMGRFAERGMIEELDKAWIDALEGRER